MQERRREHRYRLRLPVTLTFGSSAIATVCDDVSYSGMYVRIRHSAPITGQGVRVRLVLPSDGTELWLEGEVLRHGGERESCGVAVQLHAGDDEGIQRWKCFIDELAASFELLVRNDADFCELDLQARPARARPAVMLRPASPAALREMYFRDVLAGSVLADVETAWPIGTALHVQVTHPQTAEVFTFDGLVSGSADLDGPMQARVMLVNVDEVLKQEFLRFVRRHHGAPPLHGRL